MGTAYVTGVQSGRRRNVSSVAIARVAATCKHFAAFGDPQGGLFVVYFCILWYSHHELIGTLPLYMPDHVNCAPCIYLRSAAHA